MSLSVLIGVCTYRRTSILQTLASLTAMHIPPGINVALCVADNDTEASARERVETAARACPHPVHYIHAPESNISIARNAILDKAAELGCDRLLFLDDDETVSTQWLAALIDVQQQTGSALVVGPVLASYLPDAPKWMQNGRFHDTVPDVDTAGFAHTGYTCNLLLDLRDQCQGRRKIGPVGRRKSRPVVGRSAIGFRRAPWDQRLLTKQAGSRAHCPIRCNS